MHVMTVYDDGVSAFTAARTDLAGPASRLRTEE